MYLADQVLFLSTIVVSFEVVGFIIVGVLPMKLGWYFSDDFGKINIFLEMISRTCGLCWFAGPFLPRTSDT